MKKEREGTLGRHFLSLAPQETQEYTVKNIFSNVDTVGEGEGGMNWETSIGIHTLSRVKQMASAKLLYTRGAQLCAL